MKIDDDLPHPGARQKGESAEAYYCFCLYRDQDAPRGIAKIVSESGRSLPLLHRWSARWAWLERARMCDREKQEAIRRDQVKQAVDMARRQATEAQGFQRVLAAPMIELVKRLESPLAQQEIQGLRLGDLIALSLAAAKVWPIVARAEREARGAPIQDLSQFYDDDTGEVKQDAEDPAEIYDWFRRAAAALEAAGVTRQLPPGEPTDG